LYHSLPIFLDVGHDVFHARDSEGQNRFRLEVQGLDLVLQILFRALFFGGHEFGLETFHQNRGKFGAVVANKTDLVVGMLHMIDSHLERSVFTAKEALGFHLSVCSFGLEIRFLSFPFATGIDDLLIVQTDLDLSGIDLPDLDSAEDGGERFQGGAALDGALDEGLGVQTDELSGLRVEVEEKRFESGIREYGHDATFGVSALLSRAVVGSLFPSDT
jgi:hypothetical protein